MVVNEGSLLGAYFQQRAKGVLGNIQRVGMRSFRRSHLQQELESKEQEKATLINERAQLFVKWDEIRGMNPVAAPSDAGDNNALPTPVQHHQDIVDCLKRMEEKDALKKQKTITRKLINLNGGKIRLPQEHDKYINLTTYTPSPEEEDILKKGLNCHFISRPRPLNKRMEIEYLTETILKQESLGNTGLLVVYSVADEGGCVVYALARLVRPLRNTNHVNVDIQVTASLLDIKELLKWIKFHGFHLRKFCVEKGMMLISTCNAKDYLSALKYLPKLEKNAYEGVVSVHIDKKTPRTDTILHELARNEFTVVLDLYHDFKNPMAPTTSTDMLNVLFEKCRVEKYVGRMAGDLRLPKTLKTLWASVPDTSACIQLQNFLRGVHWLNSLCVCTNLNLDPEIKPLPGHFLTDSFCLYIPGVTSVEDILKATEIAIKIMPTTLFLGPDYLLFPQLNLTQDEEVNCFVSNMERLCDIYSIILPKSLKQSQKFIKKCQSLDIEWELPRYLGPSTIPNLDSW
ncbi:uncharacterized protein LOC135216542 [Macrobrachium nipponense]|uniref:uncharacterized protein LOC135216542 n=1 Tax=Macrobrachium nipponense TaxID=159736 RepID=UPI0030C7BFAA